MADGLFCIDFGSAYTKVALRRGRRTNSEMVAYTREAEDDFKVCVPSAVIVNHGAAPQYTFGRATETRRSSSTVKVYRNWKKELFRPSPAVPAAPAPVPRSMTRLESLLHSTHFQKLADQYGVTPAQQYSLKRLAIHATSLTLPMQTNPAPAEPADEHLRLATEYFTWLRGVVLGACAHVARVDEFPVRVTVPAFAPEDELAQHPGCRKLREALTRAKWPLHPERPFVTEPYANTVGALTQGSNCTRVADMFRNGLLITAIKDPNTHPAYRAVVIDVGAFTTDFATLTLTTDGRIVLLSEVEFQPVVHSVPLGMSDLDEAVTGALSPENQFYMREEAPHTDWALFREHVYLRKRPFESPAGEIGGPDERPQIDAAINEFRAKLVAEAEAFFGPLADVPFKELVLTGGGANFPLIQDALIGAAERGRTVHRKVHLPAARRGVPQRQTTGVQVVTPLADSLPRGATALGGTSAFFDMIS